MLFYGRGLGTVMQADYVKFAFKIFVTLVTGWPDANYIAQLHSLTPEKPLGYLVKNRGRICYTKVEL